MKKKVSATDLRRLQYFEVVARLGSVGGAAKELGVSPSAVSHQLAELRRSIGEDLFVRSGRGLALTNAGRLMAERLSTAFDILSSSVTSAIGEEREIIRVAACSSFGPYWLVPRMADFRRARPNMDIEMRLYGRDPELTQATADCIVTAQAVKPGYTAFDLFKEQAIAVAVPGLVKAGQNAEVPLITTDTAAGVLGDDWKTVARAAEVSLPKEPDWVRCTHYVLALEAAKAGLGAAIIPDFVAAGAIAEGKLVDLGLGRHRLENRTYRACFKEARSNEAGLRAFVSWLKRHVRAGIQPVASEVVMPLRPKTDRKGLTG